MAVTLNYPIDQLQLATILAADEAWTHLELFYSATPDGSYVTSTTRVALVSTTYSYTIEWAGGNAAMWYKVVLWNGSVNSSLNDADPFHGGGGTTLATMRILLGEHVNDITVATTTGAGSTTTAVANDIEVSMFPDDHFNGQYFQRLDTGEYALITDWVQSTTTFTLSPAITSVGDGVAFIITKRHMPRKYRTALNWAIANSYPTLNRRIVYTGHRTQAAGSDNVYEYDLPNDMRSVAQVELESDPNNASSATSVERGHPWRDIPYTYHEDGLRRWVAFSVAQPDDRRIRMTGTGMLRQVYAETDYVELEFPDINLLLDLAASYLYHQLVAISPATDIDRYEKLNKYELSMYAEHKNAFGSGKPALQTWSPASRFMRPTRPRPVLGAWNP